LPKIRQRIFAFADTERDRWVAAQAASLPPGTKVLDIGAGPCRYRPLFAHCDYKSQDFCQHLGTLEGPLAEGAAWKYGAIDYVSDASDIPVESRSFDAVLCTEVLEHVIDPAAVIREAARVLKPGGALIVSAPLTSGVHQEPDHYYGGFTPYWYRRVFADTGFRERVISANGGFFKHYGQESRRFSALLDPRRLSARTAVLVFPFWLVTLPFFRWLIPMACHLLDRLDQHQGFTVGYHVTATRT